LNKLKTKLIINLEVEIRKIIKTFWRMAVSQFD